MQSLVDQSERWLVAATSNPYVKVWDIKAEREVSSIRKQYSYARPSYLSPGGDTVLVIDEGKGDYLEYEAATGRLRKAIKPFSSSISALGVSLDGTRLVSAGSDKDPITSVNYLIKVWDGDGRLLGAIKATNTSQQQLFVPDAHRAFAVSYKTLTFIDLDSMRVTRTIRTDIGRQTCAISRHAETIACAGNGDLIAWRTSTGAESLRAHFDEDISAISFNADGMRFLTMQGNGTMRVLSAIDGELLTTTLLSEQGEWITITPEGFFVSSDHGGELLNVVRGFSVVGLDQLYQSLYRPDLVSAKLNGDPRGLVRQAAAQLDLTKVIASGDAPDVRVTVPGRSVGSLTIDGTSAAAEAEITDRGGGIGRIEWRVNGVTVGVDTPATGAPSPLRLMRSLALDSGDNAIEVTAYNGANLVASVAARLT
jgi:hypothetical protein